MYHWQVKFGVHPLHILREYVHMHRTWNPQKGVDHSAPSTSCNGMAGCASWSTSVRSSGPSTLEAQNIALRVTVHNPKDTRNHTAAAC